MLEGETYALTRRNGQGREVTLRTTHGPPYTVVTAYSPNEHDFSEAEAAPV